MKIVSLDPVATDIVVALGLGDVLVAVSGRCTGRPYLDGLPRYSEDGSPLTPGAPAIDSHASPDTVLLTGSTLDVRIREAFVGRRGASVVVAPTDLAALWADIEKVGAALGLGMLGAAIAKGLRARLDDIRRCQVPGDAVRSLALVQGTDGREPLSLALVATLRDDAHVGVVDDHTSDAAARRIGLRDAADRAALVRVGPRSVAVVEMLVAAAWPERFPWLMQRHADRFEADGLA